MKLPGNFHRVVLSGPKSEIGASKIIARPILLKGARKIQIEEIKNNQAFHINLDAAGAEKYLTRKENNFSHKNIMGGRPGLSHDKIKNHLLRDGVVCPPLVRLGVMDGEGRVFKASMAKFVQINNFLGILADAAKNLPAGKRIEIVDFCCGKSYLTFVVHYFFSEILKRPARITGIDAKAGVIENCASIGRDLECGNLNLVADDINNFDPGHKIDIALSLHACDTMTDVVLKKAVALGASVILAVPCCHKQLAGQIQNRDLGFILRYGLLRERFAAILTDALRAEWLRTEGYRADVLEFVDFLSSPKNVMIRAIKTGVGAKSDIRQTAGKFCAEPEILK
ncbi:MAG: SAM-dependent methyltransferase [Rickettsiales bacterium]|jgi:hypothetical protein|nr:SAM-dependent methyltransferase [Rickettsiales bacterium]